VRNESSRCASRREIFMLNFQARVGEKEAVGDSANIVEIITTD